MLYTNDVCRGANQLLVQLQQAHFRAELKKTGNMSVVGTLMDFFHSNPNLCLIYATEAYRVFAPEEICDWEKDYFQLAVYGFAMSNLFYVYDTETSSMTLHTSSMTLLTGMIENGSMIAKDGRDINLELTRWIKQLDADTNGTFHKSFKEGGVIRTVKLEQVSVDKYTGVIPRSVIDYNKSIIVPYSAMSCVLSEIKLLSDNQLLKIITGDKVRYVTCSPAILGKLYSPGHINTLLRNVRKGDTYIYLPSYGASVYTPGLTKLDVVVLDFIGAGKESEVDVSAVNINYDKARLFLVDKLNKSDKFGIKEHIEIGNALGIPKESFSSLAELDRIDYITSIINRTFESKIYEAILQLGYTREDYDAFKSPVGDNYTEVEIPKTLGALRTRLDTGVYKIITVTKAGKFSSIVGTNSQKYLTQVYGTRYLARFESEGVRLRKLLSLGMDKDSDLPINTVLGWCKRLNLPQVGTAFSSKYLDGAVVNKNSFASTVEDFLVRVEERKTSSGNQDNVLIRNCFATMDGDYSRDYYRNIDLSSIQAMFKLSKDE